MGGTSLLFSKEVIPIVVASSKDKFTPGSIRTAKILNIVLTDGDDVCRDIINLVEKRLEKNFNLKIKYVFFSFMVIIFLFMIITHQTFRYIIFEFNKY